MVLNATPLNPEFSVSIFENKDNNFIDLHIFHRFHRKCRPKEKFKKYVCLTLICMKSFCNVTA